MTTTSPKALRSVTGLIGNAAEAPKSTQQKGATGLVLQSATAFTNDRIVSVDRRGRPKLDAHRMPPRVAEMLKFLTSQIIGQDHAFLPILRCVQRYENGFNDPDKPVGTGFLGGPTGVGKTLTAEMLALFLHGDPDHMIKIKCGELTDKQGIAGFVGAAPTWVGHGTTEPMLTQEYIDAHASASSDITIILLDEYEKAHTDFQKLLLNVEEKGILSVWQPNKSKDGAASSNQGAKNVAVNMRKVLILKTTNCGAEIVAASPAVKNGMGFIWPTTPEEVKPIEPDDGGLALRESMRDAFSPEFLNRQDFFILYNRLKADDMPGIRSNAMKRAEKRIAGIVEGFAMRLLPGAAQWLDTHGFDPAMGARPLKRLIEDQVVTPLSNLHSESLLKPFDAFAINAAKGSTELDFGPMLLTRGRAAEKLARATTEAATVDNDAVRYSGLSSALDAVLRALPQTSSLRKPLEEAALRAADEKSKAGGANILRDAMDAAVAKAGVRLKTYDAPVDANAKSVSVATNSPATTTKSSLIITDLSGETGDVANLRAAAVAGEDKEFVAQATQAFIDLSSEIGKKHAAALATMLLSVQTSDAVDARREFSAALYDAALLATGNYEVIGRAFAAAINFDCDASIHEGEAEDRVATRRKYQLAALKDAISASEEARGSLAAHAPFVVFKQIFADGDGKDGVVPRIQAYRDAVAANLKKPRRDSGLSVSSTNRATGLLSAVAYGAQLIFDNSLRAKADSEISRLSVDKDLEMKDVERLEKLIRTFNGSRDGEAILEGIRDYERAVATSGSPFRGVEKPAVKTPRKTS